MVGGSWISNSIIYVVKSIIMPRVCPVLRFTSGASLVVVPSTIYINNILIQFYNDLAGPNARPHAAMPISIAFSEPHDLPKETRIPHHIFLYQTRSY